MNPRVPIVLLNWNGIEDTLECWASLQQQTYADFVLYLVDNGSDERNVRLLREHFNGEPRVRLIFNEENLGFTLGNNRILEEIINEDYRYVVLLNNDTTQEPGWLEQLVGTADEQQAGVVASKMVNYHDRRYMDNAGHRLLNTLEVLGIGNEEPVERFTEPFDNAGACAGAALYSVPMLRDIGIFDERFRNGFEDVELGLRAVLCGYRAVYAPKAVVYHKISRSINKIRDFEYTLGLQRNVYYIALKLFPWPVLLVNLPFYLFKSLMVLLIHTVFGRWKFLRVHLYAYYYLFARDWRDIRTARRAFFQSHQVIPFRRVLGLMTFFLKPDVERFVKYIIRREKMVFEKY